MEFRDFFVMSLIVGLFIFCIIIASYNLSTQNNADITVLDYYPVNKMFGNVSTKLNASYSESYNQSVNLVNETSHPILTTLGFAFNSVLNAGNVFMGSVITMFQYTFTFAEKVFMINPIVTGTITAIIIGLLLLGLWSLWRAGR